LVKVPLVVLAEEAGFVGKMTLPVRCPALAMAKFPLSVLCDVDPLLELELLAPELELLPLKCRLGRRPRRNLCRRSCAERIPRLEPSQCRTR
jgi:hypothetical protein